jgi:tryptophan 2,3-dioxygenase
MPYFEHEDMWSDADFWQSYRAAYDASLNDNEKNNMKGFDDLFMNEQTAEPRRLSQKARRAALFINLYRDFPILQNPYRLINHLLEIDELLATWRWRHMNMVHRMIGARVGTGGSTGKGYLREAALKHYIFSDFAELTSYLIERRHLPALSKNLERKLGYSH